MCAEEAAHRHFDLLGGERTDQGYQLHLYADFLVLARGVRLHERVEQAHRLREGSQAVFFDFLADGLDALVCDQIEGNQMVYWFNPVFLRLLPWQLLTYLYLIELLASLDVHQQRIVFAVFEAG